METKKKIKLLTEEDYDLAVHKTLEIVQKQIAEDGPSGMSTFVIPMTGLMFARLEGSSRRQK